MRLVLEVKTATRCGTCSYLNPLPGLRHETECVNCAQTIDVAGKIKGGRDGGLRYTFGGYYDAVAESLLYEGDHKLEDAHDSQGSPLALRKVGCFACACGAPLDAPAKGAADLRCAKCGEVTPVRWPDDATRQWDKRISYLVGDAGERGVALRQKLEGTVIGCGNCGAPLAQQGRQRVVVCTHCRSENFLSDKIWTKLFPRPDQHVFYLVYDMTEEMHAAAIAFLMHTGHYFFDKAQKKAIAEMQHERKDHVLAARVKRVMACEEDDRDHIPAEVAREIVLRNDLDERTIIGVDRRLTDDIRHKIVSDKMNPAFFKRWLHSNQSGIRAVAAKVAHGEALQKCATDESEEVRAVIARRVDTPPEILAVLRKDRDDGVREKARANKSYQPGFFTKLLGG